ncbi:MAG: oligosaccharide flippase family protein [Rubrobacteraceae bacterium]|jgi:O-antigen/teichoic acid export membrane protein|nr:oligosaccharide flippase family protein [Rubrobacteraceae bacterium]
MRNFIDLKGRHGARAGSVYVVGSFFVSGVLTYVFQGLSARFLGEAGYGDLVVLWTTTFLVVQVLWIGVTQTLGRFVSERLSRGEDIRPVISSVRHLQLALLGTFVVVYLIASPLTTDALFRGSLPLTVALLAAVAAYAPEYFRRGTFNGHRQAARLGVLHMTEALSRLVLAVGLLVAGMGVPGAALAIVLAPLVAVIAVRPTQDVTPEREGVPFSATKAFRFTGPVLLCVAFAQILMNGGPIFLSLLGGTRAQVGVFGAALILTRVPQYVVSPAIGALLPHASRVLATEGPRSLDRFVGKAVGVVGFVGVLMVGGTWVLGEWGIRLFAGSEFEATRGLLVSLALLAAFYLLAETLNQALFALGRARLAALGWLVGIPVCAICMTLQLADPLYRVSCALALGAFAAAVSQATFYLSVRKRPTGHTEPIIDPEDPAIP